MKDLNNAMETAKNQNSVKILKSEYLDYSQSEISKIFLKSQTMTSILSIETGNLLFKVTKITVSSTNFWGIWKWNFHLNGWELYYFTKHKQLIFNIWSDIVQGQLHTDETILKVSHEFQNL